MFRLRLLGGVLLEGPDGPVQGRASQRLPLALLSLLALAPDRILSRERAIFLLWPQLGSVGGRRALSVALHALRSALGPDSVDAVTDQLRLVTPDLTCDVWVFRDALERGDLQRAVEAYAGPLLDGLYLRNAAEFEQVVDRERDRLATQCAEALERLAEGAEEIGRHEEAVEHWRRLASQRPYSSRVARRLVLSLDVAGDRPAALAQAAVHRARVRDDLGIDPDPEFVRLVEQLTSGTLVRETATDEVTVAIRTPGPRGGGAPGPVASTDPSPLAAPTARRSKRRWLAGPLVLGAAAGAAWLLMTSGALRPTGSWGAELAPGPPVGLVLADFEGIGADTTISQIVTEVLRVDLGESPMIDLADPEVTSAAFRRMRLEPGESLTEGRAREVALREGMETVLAGTVAGAPGGTLVTVRLVNARDGSVLFADREWGDDDELIPAVDRLSTRVRSRLGESTASIESTPPLERVTSASLSAVQRYSEATQARRSFEFGKALDLLEVAVAEDPEFAMAWYALGVAAMTRGTTARALEAWETAYGLRNRLPERERLLAKAYYHQFVGEDFSEAVQTFERLLDRDPNDSAALSGFYWSSWYLGRPDVGRARLMRRIESGDAPLSTYRVAAFASSTVKQAEALIQSALERFPQAAEELAPLRVNLAADRFDYRAAETLGLETGQDDTRDVRRRLYFAELAFAQGRIEDGFERVQQAYEAEEPADRERYERSWRGRVAFNLLGRTDVWRNELLPIWAAGATGEGLFSAHAAGKALASLGEIDLARALVSANDTASREPDIPPMTFGVLAAIAEAEGRFREALRLMDRADATAQGVFTCGDGGSVDRARIYERMGLADSALVEYQGYLEPHPNRFQCGGDWGNVWKAYLRLGELHEQLGNPERARDYYGRLVDLWRYADPELQPVVAKARSAAQRLSVGTG